MSYKKLVRDKIPEIIMLNEGRSCITRTLNNEEYLFELNKKIKEELAEYLESGDIEELADLEEVLRAILDNKGVTYEEFEKIRLEKVKKRGAFKNKIYLEGLEDDNNSVPNLKDLNRIGKSWFVLYKYYEEEDKNVLVWKRCKTVKFRQAIYERNRNYHMQWLKYIIFANEKKLETNKMFVEGFDITTMACIVYDKLKNE